MYNTSTKPLMLEKIIAIASYITAGFVGILWIIIALITQNNLRHFLKYHICQSIFLSIMYFLISTFINLLFGILSYIPIIKNLVGGIAFIFTVPIIAHLSIISLCILGVLIYLIVGIVKDKYSYLPWVSDIILENINDIRRF